MARLRRIRALLAEEHALVAADQGTWEGRLVVDERVAHILVLSDSPDMTRDVNQRIEVELTRLGAGFSVTVPLAVPGPASDEIDLDEPRSPNDVDG